jgi:hypothetical protein
MPGNTIANEMGMPKDVQRLARIETSKLDSPSFSGENIPV